MPRLVLPFSGPASNFMVRCCGLLDASSSSVPLYTAPIPVLVKRFPLIVIWAFASMSADIFCPSTFSAVTLQEPWSRSRSWRMVSSPRDYIGDMDPLVRRGIELFNKGEFFACHE